MPSTNGRVCQLRYNENDRKEKVRNVARFPGMAMGRYLPEIPNNSQHQCCCYDNMTRTKIGFRLN